MNTRDDSDSEFWKQRIIDYVVHSEAASSETEVSDELDQMLWAFAEDRIEGLDMEAFWRLVQDEPAAHNVLRRIFGSLRLTEDAVGSTPDTVWLRTAKSELRERTTTSMVDMVVKAVSEGLELLVSRGRPAFSMSAIRDADDKPTDSVTHEFLIGGSLLQMTILRSGPGKFEISVTGRQLASVIRGQPLQVTAVDEFGTPVQDCQEVDGIVVLRDMSPGSYSLRITAGSDIEVGTLSVDLRN